MERVELYRYAVSNFVGTSKFHVPYADIPTSGSLNPQGFRGYSGRVIEVEVTTVDQVVGNSTVDLVKIDVEGFEDKVLEGMENTLLRSKPSLIIECLPDGPYKKVEVILKHFGYQVYKLSLKGPKMAKRVQPRRDHENFLFIHPDRNTFVW